VAQGFLGQPRRRHRAAPHPRGGGADAPRLRRGEARLRRGCRRHPASETAAHADALRAFRAEVAKRKPALTVVTGIMALDGGVEEIT
jgi:hypothetical protein